MNKEELLKRKDVTQEELDGRMLQNLRMIRSYLDDLIDDWECKRGEHKWDEWSARFCGNVASEHFTRAFFKANP